MTVAGTDIHHGQDIVTLAKKLIACEANSPRRGQHDKDKEQNHSNASPNHVELLDPRVGDFRLRLVVMSLNEGPANGVKQRLNENDPA